MKPHHLTARLWFAGAIAATLLPAEFRLGWWLPLHMVLLGGASQLIAGGQLKFSTALAMAPEPARIHPVASLFLLNAGALSIGAGRVFAVNRLTGAGAALFLTGALWSVAVAAGRWQKGLGTRFRVTRSYYLLAGASILAGGLVGAALALGFMNDSYASHRLVHMAFNLFGWAGMTIAGTAVTLLPAMLRTRAPSGRLLRPAPHLMFAGLLVLAGGLSLGSPAWAAAGGTVLLASLVPFGLAVRRVLTTRRRFPVPVSAAHLIAAIAWLGLVSAAQLWPLAAGDAAATRDLWVVGLAGGTVVQAILGAWAFPAAHGTAGLGQHSPARPDRLRARGPHPGRRIQRGARHPSPLDAGRRLRRRPGAGDGGAPERHRVGGVQGVHLPRPGPSPTHEEAIRGLVGAPTLTIVLTVA